MDKDFRLTIHAKTINNEKGFCSMFLKGDADIAIKKIIDTAINEPDVFRLFDVAYRTHKELGPVEAALCLHESNEVKVVLSIVGKTTMFNIEGGFQNAVILIAGLISKHESINKLCKFIHHMDTIISNITAIEDIIEEFKKEATTN